MGPSIELEPGVGELGAVSVGVYGSDWLIGDDTGRRSLRDIGIGWDELELPWCGSCDDALALAPVPGSRSRERYYPDGTTQVLTLIGECFKGVMVASFFENEFLQKKHH